MWLKESMFPSYKCRYRLSTRIFHTFYALFKNKINIILLSAAIALDNIFHKTIARYFKKKSGVISHGYIGRNDGNEVIFSKLPTRPADLSSGLLKSILFMLESLRCHRTNNEVQFLLVCVTCTALIAPEARDFNNSSVSILTKYCSTRRFFQH